MNEDNPQVGLFEVTATRHDPHHRGHVDIRYDDGAALRDRGIEQAASAVTAAHRRDAERALEALVALGEPFSSDDLYDHLQLTPPPAFIGALFRIASQDGMIHPVGFVTSRRPSAHGRPIRLWQAVSR